MTGASTDMLSAALAMAARGFRVFPLHAGTKRPVHKAWPEVATGDPARIRELWTEYPHANPGVLTNGHIVVDVDIKKGKAGPKSFMALGLPLDTLIVRTPTGGRHVYYSGPNKNNSIGRLGDGLDVRSFNGYVLAPGSVLLGDGDPSPPYVVEREAPVAPAPASLIARLDDPVERQSAAPVVDLDAPAALLAAVRYAEVDAPVAIEGAGGDHQTFVVACRLREMGVSEASALTILFDHWNDRCVPPWSAEELKTKIANAYAYAQNAPGSASIEAQMKGVDLSVFEPITPTPPPKGRVWFNHGDAWQKNFDWLYHGAIPMQGVAVITAASGSGKTFVSIDLARSLATGDPWFGIEPEHRGGTIVLSGEGYGSIGLRLAALQLPEAVPIAAGYVGALAAHGALATLKSDLVAKRAEMLERFGVPVRLIIFDTLSASGLLAKEDDNSEAAAAIGLLSQWGQEFNCLFVLNHHPPKKGTGTRGASAIHNSADYVVEISRLNDKAQVRQVEITKSRDGETKPLGSFTLLPVKVGEDDKGRDVVSCIVSASDRPAPIDRQGPHPQGELMVECVEWALIDHGEDIGGLSAVPLERVRDVFDERWPLTRQRTNMRRGFKGALEWVCALGIVDEIAHDGTTYLVKKEIEP